MLSFIMDISLGLSVCCQLQFQYCAIVVGFEWVSCQLSLNLLDLTLEQNLEEKVLFPIDHAAKQSNIIKETNYLDLQFMLVVIDLI